MPMIEVPRLNYIEIAMTLQDIGYPDRPKVNLADARVIFTVKEHLADSEDLIRIRKDNTGGGLVIVDPTEGKILITLTSGDLALPPSDYWYDIFIIRDNRVHSCEPGTFRVKPTVLGVLP